MFETTTWKVMSFQICSLQTDRHSTDILEDDNFFRKDLWSQSWTVRTSQCPKLKTAPFHYAFLVSFSRVPIQVCYDFHIKLGYFVHLFTKLVLEQPGSTNHLLISATKNLDLWNVMLLQCKQPSTERHDVSVKQPAFSFCAASKTLGFF